MEIVVAESQRLSTILEDFLRYVRPKERAVEPVDAPAALRRRPDAPRARRRDARRATASCRTSTRLGRWSTRTPASSGRSSGTSRATRSPRCPAGGTLSVSAHASRTSTGTSSFADEGHGMTADERDRLFTPFAHSFPGGTGPRARDRLPHRRGARRRDSRRHGAGTRARPSPISASPRDVRRGARRSRRHRTRHDGGFMTAENGPRISSSSTTRPASGRCSRSSSRRTGYRVTAARRLRRGPRGARRRARRTSS